MWNCQNWEKKFTTKVPPKFPVTMRLTTMEQQRRRLQMDSTDLVLHFHLSTGKSIKIKSGKLANQRVSILPWQNRFEFHKHFTHVFFYWSLLSSFSLLRVWLWTNFRTKNLHVKCWWNRLLATFSFMAVAIRFRLHNRKIVTFQMKKVETVKTISNLISDIKKTFPLRSIFVGYDFCGFS